MELTVGGIVGLLFAAGFIALVALLARPLWKMGAVLDQTRETIKGLSDETMPLIGEATTTISHTNHQLAKVDTLTTKAGVIADNGVQVATNVSALTTLFAATLGSPVIRVAAFTYGVRNAMNGRQTGAGKRGRRRRKG